MHRSGIFAALLASIGLLAASAATTHVAAVTNHTTAPGGVVLRDDCDRHDSAWTPTGGCTLPEGDVTLAEFNSLLLSPLAPSVIGHSAWWFDPNYLKIKAGKRIRIKNEGGRVHTFTEVENFGGGRVPPLNMSQPGTDPLTPAPECLAAGVVNLPGGATDVVDGLAPGNHKFQCCIHPWMRALVKVQGE